MGIYGTEVQRHRDSNSRALGPLPPFPEETSDRLQAVLWKLLWHQDWEGHGFITDLMGVSRMAHYRETLQREQESRYKAWRKIQNTHKSWKASLFESPSLKGCSLEVILLLRDYFSSTGIYTTIFPLGNLLLTSSKNRDKFIASWILRTKWKLSPSYNCSVALEQS